MKHIARPENSEAWDETMMGPDVEITHGRRATDYDNTKAVCWCSKYSKQGNSMSLSHAEREKARMMDVIAACRYGEASL